MLQFRWSLGPASAKSRASKQPLVATFDPSKATQSWTDAQIVEDAGLASAPPASALPLPTQSSDMAGAQGGAFASTAAQAPAPKKWKQPKEPKAPAATKLSFDALVPKTGKGSLNATELDAGFDDALGNLLGDGLQAASDDLVVSGVSAPAAAGAPATAVAVPLSDVDDLSLIQLEQPDLLGVSAPTSTSPSSSSSSTTPPLLSLESAGWNTCSISPFPTSAPLDSPNAGAEQLQLSSPSPPLTGRCQQGCYGKGFKLNTNLPCDDTFVAGQPHIQNKFCAVCRGGFAVRGDWVRTLSSAPGAKSANTPWANTPREGFWGTCDASQGIPFRIINQHARCRGPTLVLFNGKPPERPDLEPLPADMVQEDGLLWLRVAYGTVVPCVNQRGGRLFKSLPKRRRAGGTAAAGVGKVNGTTSSDPSSSPSPSPAEEEEEEGSLRSESSSGDEVQTIVKGTHPSAAAAGSPRPPPPPPPLRPLHQGRAPPSAADAFNALAGIVDEDNALAALYDAVFADPLHQQSLLDDGEVPLSTATAPPLPMGGDHLPIMSTTEVLELPWAHSIPMPSSPTAHQSSEDQGSPLAPLRPEPSSGWRLGKLVARKPPSAIDWAGVRQGVECVLPQTIRRSRGRHPKRERDETAEDDAGAMTANVLARHDKEASLYLPSPPMSPPSSWPPYEEQAPKAPASSTPEEQVQPQQPATTAMTTTLSKAEKLNPRNLLRSSGMGRAELCVAVLVAVMSVVCTLLFFFFRLGIASPSPLVFSFHAAATEPATWLLPPRLLASFC